MRGRGLGGVVVAVAILGAVAFFGVRNAFKAAPPELTLRERYEADDRIAVLLEPCGHGQPFEGDTSAMIDVLVTKLDAGAQLEPLRRSKQELAQLGPEVEQPLRRLFDDASRDIWRVAVVLNVLDVCAMAKEPWGIGIGGEAMLSPREDVRARASFIFRNHGRPEDYPLVKQAFLGCTNPETAQKFAVALKACDPGLFQYDVADFIDHLRETEGGLATTVLADTLAAEAADAVDPIVVDKLYVHSGGLAPKHRAYMIAPAAAQPESKYHAVALEELRAYLRDTLIGPRQNAGNALARAGLAREVVPMFELDGDPRVRALAVTLLTKAVDQGQFGLAEATALLRRGLSDADPNVQVECLGALLHFGDEVAWLTALRKLEGSIAERDIAVKTLREAWTALPAEAPDQARARLIQLWDRRAGEGAPGDELTSVLIAIGAVPGRASGEFLLQIAERLAGTTVRGIDGHRWCVGQAFNAGAEARQVMRERLATESDPFRRLDLISFIWQDDVPEALEVLLGVATDAALDPHERLYAAERLLYMGHAARVAPVLKATYWESTDPVLRPGLQCLLWIWYGVHA